MIGTYSHLLLALSYTGQCRIIDRSSCCTEEAMRTCGSPGFCLHSALAQQLLVTRHDLTPMEEELGEKSQIYMQVVNDTLYDESWTPNPMVGLGS